MKLFRCYKNKQNKNSNNTNNKSNRNREEKKIELKDHLNITIVDDVQSNINSLVDYLNVIGYDLDHIYSFSSPLKAEEFINNNNSDIVLMDIRMTKKSGYDTTKQLRKNNYSNLIFGLTGDVTSSSIKEGLESGMDEILEKPFNLNAFNMYLKKYGLEIHIKKDVV